MTNKSELARAYALLEHRKAEGAIAKEHPELQQAIEKTFICNVPRVVRYHHREKGAYVYVLQRFDDARYEAWKNATAQKVDDPEQP